MDGGESLASIAKRVGQATRDIVQRHPGGTIMIVAHGGVNPLVIGELIGLAPEKAIKEIRQSQRRSLQARSLQQRRRQHLEARFRRPNSTSSDASDKVLPEPRQRLDAKPTPQTL